MKNLSLVDNNWIERKNPNITPEEQAILEDTGENNKETRKNLIITIRGRTLVPASIENATVAQNIYDQHKIVDSVLIAADISLPDGHGIINCRVNNDHKQVRF